MNGTEILRIVDAIHRDKNIDQDIVFEGIEQAIASAARRHFGEECEIQVDIDRESGEPSASVDGDSLDSDEIGDLLGRIAAQTAKQVMIQKIREAERDALHAEYSELTGHMISGSISQVTPGAATVNLGKVEGLLPRSEQIPGETHRVGERVRAIVLEVKKAGSRVKIVLSRTHPEMVRRLFELEIPEIGEHVIEVRSLAREAGYRSKVAVSCFDNKIDAVGACVGVRGSRIKNIVDELAGERIDIVRWNDSLQVLVPNALQPAEVEDVILCPMLGKVIVLVREDQLSLSIGKKGQNVRLASKLVGWDIHVLTQERLDELLDSAVEAFSKVPEVTEELAENLVAQGFFTFDDLSVIEPDQLAELGGLTAEQCDKIVEYADAESERLEQEEKRAAEEARELRKREAALAKMEESMGIQAEKEEKAPPAAAAAASESTEVEQPAEDGTATQEAADTTEPAAETEATAGEEPVETAESPAVAAESETTAIDEPSGAEVAPRDTAPDTADESKVPSPQAEPAAPVAAVEVEQNIDGAPSEDGPPDDEPSGAESSNESTKRQPATTSIPASDVSGNGNALAEDSKTPNPPAATEAATE